MDWRTFDLLMWMSQLSSVLLVKGVMKICSKFTGEDPCRSVISLKLLCSFIEIILRHECSPVIMLHMFRTSFLKNISGGLLLNVWSVEHSLFIVVKLLRFKYKRWRIFLKYLLLIHFPAGNYMFKVNNRNTRTRCEICSKLTIKAPERRHACQPDAWHFGHISHLVLVFLLLTLIG